MDTVEIGKSLFKEGLELKKKGDLDAAKDSFARALSNDPTNPDVCYHLGMLEFIRGQYGASINAYLGYVHLQLRAREAQLRGDLPLSKEESEFIENFYSILPEEAKNALPTKSASYILEDNDICNHVGHSFIGGQEVSDEKTLTNLRLYYSKLVSPQLVDITLDRFDITIEDFNDMNREVFVPNGRMVLLEHIEWGSLDSEDIVELYFK